MKRRSQFWVQTWPQRVPPFFPQHFHSDKLKPICTVFGQFFFPQHILPQQWEQFCWHISKKIWHQDTLRPLPIPPVWHQCHNLELNNFDHNILFVTYFPYLFLICLGWSVPQPLQVHRPACRLFFSPQAHAQVIQNFCDPVAHPAAAHRYVHWCHFSHPILCFTFPLCSFFPQVWCESFEHWEFQDAVFTVSCFDVDYLQVRTLFAARGGSRVQHSWPQRPMFVSRLGSSALRLFWTGVFFRSQMPNIFIYFFVLCVPKMLAHILAF